MTSKLDQLREMAALGSPAFAPIVEQSLREAQGRDSDLAGPAFDLTVRVGVELAPLIRGRVSTEVDARLSFDGAASLDARARSSQPTPPMASTAIAS